MARKSYKQLTEEMKWARGRYECLIDHGQKLHELLEYNKRMQKEAEAVYGEAHRLWQLARDKKRGGWLIHLLHSCLVTCPRN